MVYKPDRAHFCKILGRCVLKFDHFMPWINNAVGFFNFKYFLLFVVYTALTLVLAALSQVLQIYVADAGTFTAWVLLLVFALVACSTTAFICGWSQTT